MNLHSITGGNINKKFIEHNNVIKGLYNTFNTGVDFEIDVLLCIETLEKNTQKSGKGRNSAQSIWNSNIEFI